MNRVVLVAICLLNLPAHADLTSTVKDQLIAQKQTLVDAEKVVAKRLEHRQDIVESSLRMLALLEAKPDASVERSVIRHVLRKHHREMVKAKQDVTRVRETLSLLKADLQKIKNAPAKLPLLRFPIVGGVVARSFGFTRAAGLRVGRLGVEIQAPKGTLVRVAADGVVDYVDSMDQIVVVNHGTFTTIYAAVLPGAAQGAKLLSGQTIGTVTSERAHFEVRLHYGPSGIPVDPTPFFVK